MAYDEQLAARIREVLADRTVREVRMFGGLSFMVDDKLVVAADTHGRLMLKVDPDRADELLARPGADWPSMGKERMGRGWLVVDASGTSGDDLAWWVGRALEHHDARAS